MRCMFQESLDFMCVLNGCLDLMQAENVEKLISASIFLLQVLLWKGFTHPFAHLLKDNLNLLKIHLYLHLGINKFLHASLSQWCPLWNFLKKNHRRILTLYGYVKVNWKVSIIFEDCIYILFYFTNNNCRSFSFVNIPIYDIQNSPPWLYFLMLCSKWPLSRYI